MYFLLTAYDHPNSLEKRLEARESHIKYIDDLFSTNKVIIGVAILDKENNMCGSSLIYSVENREELNTILENEPYIIGNVWEKWNIEEVKIGPSFLNNL